MLFDTLARWLPLPDRTLQGTVFLDFDGVLHPGFDNTFSCLPVFERLLKKYPQLQVVISSSWREARTLEELRQIFHVRLRQRIVGLTPILPGSNRQAEIRQYCEAHGIRRYVILDDGEELFPRHCPNLYLTNPATGLTAADLRHIIAILRRQSR